MSRTYKTAPYRIRLYRAAGIPVARIDTTKRQSWIEERDALATQGIDYWDLRYELRGPRSGAERFIRRYNLHRERQHVADRLRKGRYDHIESTHLYEGWW